MASSKATSQKSSGIRQAVKEPNAKGWAERKSARILDDSAKPKKATNNAHDKSKPAQAVKIRGKMGPSQNSNTNPTKTRKADNRDPNNDRAKRAEAFRKAEARMKPLPTRAAKPKKTTQAERKEIVRKHFKNILSGKAGRMQGNK